jgi:hypothetical protein
MKRNTYASAAAADKLLEMADRRIERGDGEGTARMQDLAQVVACVAIAAALEDLVVAFNAIATVLQERKAGQP